MDINSSEFVATFKQLMSMNNLLSFLYSVLNIPD